MIARARPSPASARPAAAGPFALALSLSLALGALVAPAAGAAGSGYWLLGGDGGVFSYGVAFAGSAASDPTLCPPNTSDRLLPDGTCWSIAATPDGKGYWILNGDALKVYPFGDATFYGDPAPQESSAPRDLWPVARAIVPTSTGHGYWVLTVPLSGAGRILPFGDAGWFGDTQTLVAEGYQGFNGMPAGMAATPDGKGYWEVHSDGGVFAFGDAGYFGSMASHPLNQPVVGMAATPDGKGYWWVAADGGVFAFGDAVFGGSMAGTALAAPVVGMARNPAGPGYWLAASDGGLFALGGAPYLGSMAGLPLARPIFAVAPG